MKDEEKEEIKTLILGDTPKPLVNRLKRLSEGVLLSSDPDEFDVQVLHSAKYERVRGNDPKVIFFIDKEKTRINRERLGDKINLYRLDTFGYKVYTVRCSACNEYYFEFEVIHERKQHGGLRHAYIHVKIECPEGHLLFEEERTH